MLYQVSFTHHHLEDHSDETEHDIEADSERDALLRFLGDYELGVHSEGDPASEALELHGDFDGTLGELVDAFLADLGKVDRQALDFWIGSADLYNVYHVGPEDSRACLDCGGSGRVADHRSQHHPECPVQRGAARCTCATLRAERENGAPKV